jgi:hypothetical protein
MSAAERTAKLWERLANGNPEQAEQARQELAELSEPLQKWLEPRRFKW